MLRRCALVRSPVGDALHRLLGGDTDPQLSTCGGARFIGAGSLATEEPSPRRRLFQLFLIAFERIQLLVSPFERVQVQLLVVAFERIEVQLVVVTAQ